MAGTTGDHTDEVYIAGLSKREAWVNKHAAVSAAVLGLLKADCGVPAAKLVVQVLSDVALEFDVTLPAVAGADPEASFGCNLKAAFMSLLCRCYLHVSTLLAARLLVLEHVPAVLDVQVGNPAMADATVKIATPFASGAFLAPVSLLRNLCEAILLRCCSHVVCVRQTPQRRYCCTVTPAASPLQIAKCVPAFVPVR